MAFMNRSRRFWLIYSAAWVPYAASFVVIFLAQGGRSIAAAVTAMLYNIVTVALLGVGVVWMCGRLQLRPRASFFIAHLFGAIVYSFLWGAAVTVLLTIASSLERGTFAPFVFGNYALQWLLFSGLMIYGTIASVTYIVQVSERLRVEEARRARAETLRARAELAALRAQLNPHFLFNTLHSLMALVRHHPAAAEDALERFAALLRYVLEIKRDENSNHGHVNGDDLRLADEWRFVKDYLALESLRIGSRLKVETRIAPDTLNCRLPAFTLQPVVENAIKHAIAPRARGGNLFIESRFDSENSLRLEVRDDGAGTTADAIASSDGLGLLLVRQRLEARYDGRALLRIETTPGNGFTVVIIIPIETFAQNDTINTEIIEEDQETWQFAQS